MSKPRKAVPVVDNRFFERDSSPRVIRSSFSAKRQLRVFFPETGRTKQSFKAECDINNIMARYQRTGVLDFVNKHAGSYGDCTGLEFSQAQEVIVKAKEMFADMPAKLRARFDNEPAKFLAFMDDPENMPEAVRLGLAKPREVEATPPAKPVVEAPQAPGAAPEGAAGASK